PVCVTIAAPAAYMQNALRTCARCAHRTSASASIPWIHILAQRVSSYVELFHPAGGRARAQGEGPGMSQGTDEMTRAGEHTDPPHPPPHQSAAPSPSAMRESPGWLSAAPAGVPTPSRPPPVAPSPPATASPRDPGAGARLGGGEARREIMIAREIRADGLVGGLTAAEIAAEIHDRCGSYAGASRIRAYPLALGVSLAHVGPPIPASYANHGPPG